MSAHIHREKYRKELCTAILDAARELFVQDGYESFSMRKLAKEVECSHGNIYLYFKNKQQLFDCLVEDSFTQLSQALERLQHGDQRKDPISLLKKAARIYIDFGLRNPNAYEFAFIIRRTGTARPWNPHPAFVFLRNTIKRCVEEKRFRPVDVDTTTQAMWAAVHGVTSLLILRPSFPWVATDKLIRQVVDSAVDSLVVGRVSKRQKCKACEVRSPARKRSSTDFAASSRPAASGRTV
jgi:AcrR family transcriptional regulator